MTPADRAGKHRAREAALQMLYQWEIARSSADEAIATYWPAHDANGEVSEELRTFANGVVHGVVERLAELDALIAARAVNWRVERMAVIDRMVLRLAVYELIAGADTPPRPGPRLRGDPPAGCRRRRRRIPLWPARARHDCPRSRRRP